MKQAKQFRSKTQRALYFKNKITGDLYLSNAAYDKRVIDGIEFVLVHPVSGFNTDKALRAPSFIRSESLKRVKETVS